MIKFERNRGLSFLITSLTVVVAVVAPVDRITNALKLPHWFDFICGVIILIIGIEIAGRFDPEASYPYGLISLLFFLTGTTRVRYFVVLIICFTLAFILVNETYDLVGSGRSLGLVGALIVMYFLPIVLFGTPEMKKLRK